MKKCVLILLFLFWMHPSGFAQLKNYSFQEAEILSKENPKPFVVFIHTSWCKYCKMMEQSTFKKQEIIKILNDNYYFIGLDAEDKTDIRFNNHTFKFKPNGTNTGINELATALATINSQIVYPTLTILAPDYTIVFQKSSFINAKELQIILEK